MSNRILVVEDEEAIRKVVKTYLESAGFEVMTVDNGVDALPQLWTRFNRNWLCSI